jgi:hypothetical protein
MTLTAEQSDAREWPDDQLEPLLGTLHIDRAADSGTYTEPNVWTRHR